MREERFLLELPVKLTDSEEQQFSRELVGEISVQGNLEAELAAKSADIKGKIKNVKLRVQQLHKIVSLREEPRQVECIDRFNTELDQIELVRLDTGDVVKSRKPEPDERQERLRFDKGKGKKLDA